MFSILLSAKQLTKFAGHTLTCALLLAGTGRLQLAGCLRNTAGTLPLLGLEISTNMLHPADMCY